jgi:hypothetical protein
VNLVEAALRLAAEILRASRLGWAVVGGLAVSARAEPRTTRDVDIAVAVSGDAEAESLLYRLQGQGLSVVSVVEQSAKNRLATARLRPSTASDLDEAIKAVRLIEERGFARGKKLSEEFETILEQEAR